MAATTKPAMTEMRMAEATTHCAVDPRTWPPIPTAARSWGPPHSGWSPRPSSSRSWPASSWRPYGGLAGGGRRRSAATAITVAYGAALTKAVTGYVSQGWGHVFIHVQPYMLAVSGLGTVFLLQNALHAGPITASRTTLVTVNPLLSIVLGVTPFGDVLRGGPVDLPRDPGPGRPGGRRRGPHPVTAGGRDRRRRGGRRDAGRGPGAGHDGPADRGHALSAFGISPSDRAPRQVSGGRGVATKLGGRPGLTPPGPGQAGARLE